MGYRLWAIGYRKSICKLLDIIEPTPAAGSTIRTGSARSSWGDPEKPKKGPPETGAGYNGLR